MWSLELIAGPGSGSKYPLAEDPLILGRHRVAHLAFPEDSFLSGRHCSLHATPSGIVLKDLGSTNGTFLNGRRVLEAEARPGDLISAGSLTLRVAETAAAIPAPPAPGALPVTAALTAPFAAFLKPPPAAPRPHGALACFAALAEPLYGLVDAACDPAIAALLAATTEPSRSLYDAQADSQSDAQTNAQPEPAPSHLAKWAPHLVSLSPGSPLTAALLDQGWGKGWTSFFTTPAPFDELRLHFRKFLMVQIEVRDEVYFRFYDPGILRNFLPAASPAEVATFFGPVTAFLVEAEHPATLLRLTPTPAGIATTPISLA